MVRRTHWRVLIGGDRLNYDNILEKFNVKEHRGDTAKAVCPYHLDKEASLSINHNKDEGKTLIFCHAGCQTRDILDKVGLKMTDLYDRPLDKNNKNNSKIEAVYHYKNESGEILFDKVRFKGKKFSQRRIIGKSTVWGLDAGIYYETYPGSDNWSKKKRDNAITRQFPSIDPVIYNLPNVINAVKSGQAVYFPEGEKDCQNLIKLGLVATCNFDGASKSSQKPKWRKAYNKYFTGADVILIPDNDDPGRAHMNNIAENLNGIAKSIKIIKLEGLPEKGDISDWLAMGKTKEELQDLIHNANEWTPENLSEDLDTVPVEFNPKYVNESGNKTTIMPVMENIISVLKHYNYEIKYNEILRKIFVYRNGKFINEIGDDTIYEIKDKCIIHKLNIPPQQIKPQLYRIGIQNTFNPVRDYLLECKSKWDGKSRLNELYETLKCDETSEKFKEKYIRKMLVTGVHLILSEHVTHAEGVLTLAGDQGIGKTSWFKNLMPKKFINDEKQMYFVEGKDLDLKKKDSLMECTSAWMLELGEVSSTFKKTEQDDLKNFITRPTDRFRVPYGTGSKDYRRNTFFCATVNDREFLSDDTGNRRWWVLYCIAINYKHNIDMDAIWGEAVYLWETGKETNYFTLEEQKEMNEYNSRFETLDNTTLLIMSYFNFNNEIRYWMKASDVFEILGRPTNFNTKKLGIALGKLKLDTKPGSARAKYYSMPPPKDNCNINFNFNPKNFERANYIDIKEVIEVSKLKSNIL